MQVAGRIAVEAAGIAAHFEQALATETGFEACRSLAAAVAAEIVGNQGQTLFSVVSAEPKRERMAV